MGHVDITISPSVRLWLLPCARTPNLNINFTEGRIEYYYARLATRGRGVFQLRARLSRLRRLSISAAERRETQMKETGANETAAGAGTERDIQT